MENESRMTFFLGRAASGLKRQLWRISMLELAVPATAQAAEADVSAFSALWVPLLIVVALAALAWWLVRSRASLVQRDGPLRLIQIIPVGPRERLLLVELDGRRLLIGATPQSISLIGTAPAIEPADAAN